MEELRADLFSVSENTSLCHCVSKDLSMSKGIAALFLEKFGRVEDLKSQKAEVGSVAFLQEGQRYIYYLVTKEKYWQKPTYENLERSLRSLALLCRDHQVKHLALPRIASGLDRLSWPKVKKMIEEIFRGSAVKLSVYSL